MEIKRSKGRPKKAEVDYGTIITDPLFGPHKIIVTKDQYAVVQVSDVAKDKPKGFYTTLPSALGKIAKLQIHVGKTYSTINGYIKEYNEIINKLNNTIYNEQTIKA